MYSADYHFPASHFLITLIILVPGNVFRVATPAIYFFPSVFKCQRSPTSSLHDIVVFRYMSIGFFFFFFSDILSFARIQKNKKKKTVWSLLQDVHSNDAEINKDAHTHLCKYTTTHMLTGPGSVVVNDRAEKSIQVLWNCIPLCFSHIYTQTWKGALWENARTCRLTPHQELQPQAKH